VIVDKKMKYSYIFFLLLVHFVSLGQNEERFYKTIDTLCSPIFHGRGPTFQGDQITAQYLNTLFADADSVYLQRFTYPINTFPSINTLQIHHHNLKIGYDYIAKASSPSIKGKYSFLHFPTSAKKIFTHEVKQKSYCVFLHDSLRHKLDSLLPFMKSCKGVFYESENLLSSMSRKLDETPTFEILDKKFIHKDSHLKINFDSVLDSNYNSYNVIAEIKGQNPDSVIIVCAHYDHLGHLDKNTIIVGANDNASGVSMMLELYYYFKQIKPLYTIRFIAFAAEECGLIGSKFYVQNLKINNIKYVINLDLMGAGSKGLTMVNAVDNKFLYERLLFVNQKYKFIETIKQRPNAPNSDHYPFSMVGIPAVFLYANGDVGGYHDVEDIPSKLEKGHFLALFSLLVGLIDKGE